MWLLYFNKSLMIQKVKIGMNYIRQNTVGKRLETHLIDFQTILSFSYAKSYKNNI